MPIWNDDPWITRSEEFYLDWYKSGSCPACGQSIGTRLSICEPCPGMERAREAFKDRIYLEAAIKRTGSHSRPAGRAYNADAYIEPQEKL